MSATHRGRFPEDRDRSDEARPGARRANVSGLRRAVRPRRRVLLVEDETLVRRALERMLHKIGCEVHAVASGAEAVELFHRPLVIDLLVTDVMMPSGSGPGLAGQLWASHPELPVIFVTGFGDAEMEGWSGRQFRVLMKPFRAEELERVVCALMPNRASGKKGP